MIHLLFILALLLTTSFEYSGEMAEEQFCIDTGSSYPAYFSNEFHASQILLTQQFKKNDAREDTPHSFTEKIIPSYISVALYNKHQKRKNSPSITEQFEELTDRVKPDFNQTISSLEKFKIELSELEKAQQQLHPKIPLKEQIDQLESLLKESKEKFEQ